MKTALSSEGPTTLDSTQRMPARGGSTRIRRFNGITRRTTNWDGLHRDSELWLDNGDCLVHFCSYGASQRGASLKVPFEAVQKVGCLYLTQQCLHIRSTHSPNASDGAPSRPTSSDSSSSSLELSQISHELYIPAPPNTTRTQAFSYHLTTRNFFAYAIGAPLVGDKLSTTLAGLWSRLGEWQIPSRLPSFIVYLRSQGYLSFAENAEHALACLKFAEDTHLKDMWVDAFVHCVGMHERLDLSPEWAGISRTTTALIIRASLEMDLHIARVVRAVGVFLEEELGPEYLGLSKPARDHLDYFRSFLHAFYVDKLGYFPPRETARWDKKPWNGMFRDFQCLYDYLADTISSCDFSDGRGLTGGVCVIQNVQAFDRRHGYTPQAHPLPLLPQKATKSRTSLGSQKGLRNFKLGRAATIPETRVTPNQALANAVNCVKPGVMTSLLVQEYRRFERQKVDGKLDVFEARKVRWLLIYGILQMLSSIMKAPKEVKDTDVTSYPLCVLTAGCPTWVDEQVGMTIEREDTPRSMSATTWVPRALDALEGRTSRISIHPDCEADSAEDFFASTGISRQCSTMSLNASNSPNGGTSLSRTASIRESVQSSVHALSKSVVGSLSKRNSLRRQSLPPPEPKKMISIDEMTVVEDVDSSDSEYDDEETRPQTAVYAGDEPDIVSNSAWQEFDFELPTTTCEPVLEHFQLDMELNEIDYVLSAVRQRESATSPADSRVSATSAEVLDSNRSSYNADVESPGTEMSSMYGGSRRNSDASTFSNTVDSSDDNTHRTPQKSLSSTPSFSTIGTKSSCASVNAGCYVPTGMRSTSGFAHGRSSSAESLLSTPTSAYAFESPWLEDIPESTSFDDALVIEA